MKLDSYQQAVVDCDSNAVVSAGAGSGKTTVLARRFLRLIEERKASVSEILTLTFTRKAAAEMYERIYSLLTENIGSPAAAEAVAEFDKAVISTLDSFCSRIARDCCADFGLTPFFKTDETAVRALAEDVSLDFILANSDSRFLKDFIYINGFENVWRNYFVFIATDYLSIGRPADFSDIFECQKKTVEAELKKAAAGIDDVVRGIFSLDPAASKAIADAQAMLSGLSSCLELASDGKVSEIGSLFSGIKLRKPGGKVTNDDVPVFKELVDEFKSFSGIISELVCTIGNRELTEGLFALTSAFQDELFSRKRSSGVLGFQDVLTIAVSGLRRDHELRRHYKSLFRYIMIDEFQDNNGMQKELLYLLSEQDGTESEGIPAADQLNPRKLFFVGDEKQSIYRFRGADVSVFKQLSMEIERAGGAALSLKRNYRSEPGLIDFFNRLFSGVMRDSDEDYQAVFEPLESRPAALHAAPDIRLLYKPYDADLPEDSLTAEESEARAIAEYILNSVGKLELPDAGGPRTAGFSDFAMLFRSGTNQRTYEKVFRAKGIPYSVHSVRSLFQEAPVNDIYNLLQICVYPEDKTASAAFLRSPLINLSDFSVVGFLLSERAVFAEENETCCVTEDDRSKFLRAKKLYDEINSRIDREPIATIIDDIWYKSGYRYLLLRDSSLHGYLEYYDYLRQLAVKYDEQGCSTAEFLDYIRSNLGDYKKIEELKVLGYSGGGVEMMPVHQSKGLEFPIVIIANAGNTGMNDRGGSAPAYISPVDGLSFNLVPDSGEGEDVSSQRCNFFYSRGKEETRLREEAELRRLLYVALTRAECHLVVSGCHGRQNRSGQRSMLNIFLSALGWVEGVDPAALDGQGVSIELIENMTWTNDGGLERALADMSAILELYRSAEPELFMLGQDEFSATELNAAAAHELTGEGESVNMPPLEPKLESLLSEEGLEADFGTLTHGIIEWCIKNNRTAVPPEPVEFAAEMQGLFSRIPEDSRMQLFSGAVELAKGFFKSRVWKSAAASGKIESELAFSLISREAGEEIFINGIIDLVFESEDFVQIVDFKTDRRIIPGEYNRQMQIYIEAASEIFGKPARCVLFYLRGAVEVEAGESRSG